MKWLKSAYGTFFLYKFWKSFVFLAHAAKTENGARKIYKLGKPIFLYIGMTYFLDGVIWCMSCKVGPPNEDSPLLDHEFYKTFSLSPLSLFSLFLKRCTKYIYYLHCCNLLCGCYCNIHWWFAMLYTFNVFGATFQDQGELGEWKCKNTWVFVI